MSADDSKKLKLFLTGPSKGPPTLDDIVKMFEAISGRPATAAEIAQAKTVLDDHVASLAQKTSAA
jgi:hypothetical protein